MRRNLDGTAHMLACGCAACRDHMQLVFARIVDASYVADELAVLAERTRPRRIGEGLSEQTIRRIQAYSGGYPNAFV